MSGGQTAVQSAQSGWFRQPLVHFVIGAMVLFLVDGLLHGGDDSSIIRADDATLIDFMQVSQKAFAPELAQAEYRAMPEAEREQLKQRFIESEVLFREALKLGLDQHDYLIRSRLIQKMDYLLLGSATGQPRYEHAALMAWFNDNRENYRVSAKLSFSHIFFPAELTGQGDNLAAAQHSARATLDTLRTEGITAAGAHRFGERFYFHRDYVHKEPELIASHFGAGFLDQLSSAAIGQWSEPVQSEYGVHLVYLIRQQDAYLPDYAEVAGAVQMDYQRHLRQQQRTVAIAKLAQRYRVQSL